MRFVCEYWSEKCSQDKNFTKPCFFLVNEITTENDIAGPSLGFNPIRFYQYIPNAVQPFQSPIDGGYYNTQTFNDINNDFRKTKKTLNNAFIECQKNNSNK